MNTLEFTIKKTYLKEDTDNKRFILELDVDILGTSYQFKKILPVSCINIKILNILNGKTYLLGISTNDEIISTLIKEFVYEIFYNDLKVLLEQKLINILMPIPFIINETQDDNIIRDLIEKTKKILNINKYDNIEYINKMTIDILIKDFTYIRKLTDYIIKTYLLEVLLPKSIFNNINYIIE